MPVAWTLLGIGAVASAGGIALTVGEETSISAWLPTLNGLAGLGIGWGVTLLLIGRARRVMTWIMIFNTAWALVVGTLLTMALLRS